GQAVGDADAARHLVIVLDGGASAESVGGENITVIGIGTASADCTRISLDEIAHPDALTLVQASQCVLRMARYRGTPHPADVVDFLQFDPDVQWSRADGRIQRVPIGVSEGGLPVHLDINEAARSGVGPHGLCVGATGSGKSEFLRTFAMGLITA